MLTSLSRVLVSQRSLEDARRKRQGGAGPALVGILRFGNSFVGPWYGDAIPLAAAAFRLGTSPRVAGARAMTGSKLIKLGDLYGKGGDRSERHLPVADVPPWTPV